MLFIYYCSQIVLTKQRRQENIVVVKKVWKVFSYFFKKLILFTNPSIRAGYDTRSIFKRSLTVPTELFLNQLFNGFIETFGFRVSIYLSIRLFLFVSIGSILFQFFPFLRSWYAIREAWKDASVT